MLNLKKVNLSRYKSPSVLQQWNNCLQTQVQQTDGQTDRQRLREGRSWGQTDISATLPAVRRRLQDFRPISSSLFPPPLVQQELQERCVCVAVWWHLKFACVSRRRDVEQSRVISLQRKARICTAAGTKSERVRERVTNRQREREREWDRSVFLYVWGCCQHAAGYWSKTIGGDVSEKAGLSEYEARSLFCL